MRRNTKLTTEEYISRAQKLHGDLYDYSETKYIDSKTKVCIICPEHGKFWQFPNNHLKGCGCPECAKNNNSKRQTSTIEDFVKKANAIHNNKYDYSKVEYKNAISKVCIICPEHGEFWQTPNSHLNGNGCPKCGRGKQIEKKTITKDEFIKRSKEVHGEKYDYSNVEYKGCYAPVTIICPKHGKFKQQPILHYHGNGCPECAKENLHNKFCSNKEEFITKARLVHGDKYDYSKVAYFNGKTKVCIICPEHGEFWQAPNSHLQGHGCKKCAMEATFKSTKLSKEEFVERSNITHNNKYDYSKSVFRNEKEKTCIICPEHGEFWQEVYHHMIGCGCPQCTIGVSDAEKEIFDFLKSKNEKVINNDRSIISPFEIDIFLPEKNIGIEYNGLLWHSEKYGKEQYYHYNKMIRAEEKGVSLVQIFEDEYLHKKEIVKEKLLHIIGNNCGTKVMGRKCTVSLVDKSVGSQFMDKNHIQGHGLSTIYIGAFYDTKLIAAMSLLKRGEEWELTRYAGKMGYVLQGVAGKIFNFFVKNYNPCVVKTFADRRWTINRDKNLYTILGFKEDSIIQPDYRYILPNKAERFHKFNFRKKILNKKFGLPLSMTESEMTKELGYYKIWDCGLIKYIWKNGTTN